MQLYARRNRGGLTAVPRPLPAASVSLYSFKNSATSREILRWVGRELEDSCCFGKSRPSASQMHAAAGHVVTILIAPTTCQAYPGGYNYRTTTPRERTACSGEYQNVTRPCWTHGRAAEEAGPGARRPC